MKELDHPVLGPLRLGGSMTTCDWMGTIVLPAFAECYERWCDDASEFHRDRRSDAHRRGEFPMFISTGLGPSRFWKNEAEEDIEPSAPHVAAFRLMTQRHDVLADNLAEEFAAFVRDRGMDWFMGDEEHFERLLQRDMILGTLELQSVTLWSRSRGGLAYAGLAFHSEIWEPEHGIGAVALGDRIIRIGNVEDSWQREFPPCEEEDPQ